MGTAGQSAGGDAFGSPLCMTILLMVVIFAIFYFLIIRPQQQEAKRLKAMLSALKKGDKVITSSGIYGVITKVEENDIQVEIAENVRIKMIRSNIAGKL